MVKQLNSKQPKYYNSLDSIDKFSPHEKSELAPVVEKYSFRANEYYLSLIDWDDPDDPIRRLIIPHPQELHSWGRLDPSDEQHYTVMPGVEHKYNSTALLLVSNICGGICRYCFRKRVFINRHDEILTDLPAALDYINQHKEITNVLLTGGDPLMLSTDKLEEIISALLPINHVKIVRIGSKIPAYNPYRILNDRRLLDFISGCQTPDKQLYVITHFNHDRELTEVAIEAVRQLHRAGAELANQTPIIRGVNDLPDTLAQLFQNLSCVGVPPYYVFQCRPASGNRDYIVPVEEAYQIFEHAKARVSGLAKRARFVMSHSTGKIEVIGMTARHIYFKYHRAADDEESSKFMVFKSNPRAYWFDDYQEVVREKRLGGYCHT